MSWGRIGAEFDGTPVQGDESGHMASAAAPQQDKPARRPSVQQQQQLIAPAKIIKLKIPHFSKDYTQHFQGPNYVVRQEIAQKRLLTMVDQLKESLAVLQNNPAQEPERLLSFLQEVNQNAADDAKPLNDEQLNQVLAALSEHLENNHRQARHVTRFSERFLPHWNDADPAHQRELRQEKFVGLGALIEALTTATALLELAKDETGKSNANVELISWLILTGIVTIQQYCYVTLYSRATVKPSLNRNETLNAQEELLRQRQEYSGLMFMVYCMTSLVRFADGWVAATQLSKGPDGKPSHTVNSYIARVVLATGKMASDFITTTLLSSSKHAARLLTHHNINATDAGELFRAFWSNTTWFRTRFTPNGVRFSPLGVVTKILYLGYPKLDGAVHFLGVVKALNQLGWYASDSYIHAFLRFFPVFMLAAFTSTHYDIIKSNLVAQSIDAERLYLQAQLEPAMAKFDAAIKKYGDIESVPEAEKRLLLKQLMQALLDFAEHEQKILSHERKGCLDPRGNWFSKWFNRPHPHEQNWKETIAILGRSVNDFFDGEYLTEIVYRSFLPLYTRGWVGESGLAKIKSGILGLINTVTSLGTGGVFFIAIENVVLDIIYSVSGDSQEWADPQYKTDLKNFITLGSSLLFAILYNYGKREEQRTRLAQWDEAILGENDPAVMARLADRVNNPYDAPDAGADEDEIDDERVEAHPHYVDHDEDDMEAQQSPDRSRMVDDLTPIHRPTHELDTPYKVAYASTQTPLQRLGNGLWFIGGNTYTFFRGFCGKRAPAEDDLHRPFLAPRDGLSSYGGGGAGGAFGYNSVGPATPVSEMSPVKSVAGDGYQVLVGTPESSRGRR